MSYIKNTPNTIDRHPTTVNAVKYILSENSPKKNVVIIPAISCDNEYINVNIPLYLALFYFPLQTYLRYPPWLTHKYPLEAPAPVANAVRITYMTNLFYIYLTNIPRTMFNVYKTDPMIICVLNEALLLTARVLAIRNVK